VYNSAGYNSARVLSQKLPAGMVGDGNIRDFEARMEMINASLPEDHEIIRSLTAREMEPAKRPRADSLLSYKEVKEHNSPQEEIYGKLNESLSDYEGGKSDDSF